MHHDDLLLLRAPQCRLVVRVRAWRLLKLHALSYSLLMPAQIARTGLRRRATQGGRVGHRREAHRNYLAAPQLNIAKALGTLRLVPGTQLKAEVVGELLDGRQLQIRSLAAHEPMQHGLGDAGFNGNLVHRLAALLNRLPQLSRHRCLS